MKKERENIAKEAINQYVQHSCAFLLPGTTNSVATDVGSGIIINTGQDNLFILTAKHIAEAAQSQKYRLGFFQCSNLLSDFVHGIILCPYEIDVGLLIIKDTYFSQIRHLAVKPECIPKKDHEIKAQDSIVLCGFPAEMSRFNQSKGEQGFTVLTYWCVPENVTTDLKGRCQLEWDDAVAWKDGRDFNLPSPEGMSGGPLWRFRKPDQASVWSPSEIGKIIRRNL